MDFDWFMSLVCVYIKLPFNIAI